MSAVAATVERALVPLDRARARLLRALMPLSSRLAADREARVAVLGIALVVLGFVGTMLIPLWMLALGPIVLGVPHVVADIRYCAVRTGWIRRPALWLGVGGPMLALTLGAGLEVGMAAVAAACVSAEGPAWKRWTGTLLAALAAAGLVWWPYEHGLLWAHLHNFVAVLLWWCWRPRERPLHVVVLGLFVLGSGLIALGCAVPPEFALGGWMPHSLDLDTHLRSLGRGMGPWALQAVLLYCFAQSVHYSMWLRLVPEEDRDRPTPRTFRASFEALQAELGLPFLLGAFALCLGLAVWACFDLATARMDYLRFARFHLVLELCALGLLWVEGWGTFRPGPSTR